MLAEMSVSEFDGWFDWWLRWKAGPSWAAERHAELCCYLINTHGGYGKGKAAKLSDFMPPTPGPPPDPQSIAEQKANVRGE
jgi:hypothetical protein